MSGTAAGSSTADAVLDHTRSPNAVKRRPRRAKFIQENYCATPVGTCHESMIPLDQELVERRLGRGCADGGTIPAYQ